jgi:Na+/citrate or Na+/malate symporter
MWNELLWFHMLVLVVLIPRTFIRSVNDIVKTSSWVTVLLLTLLTGRIVEFAREVL